MSIIGQKIKEKRHLKGLTQEDLANLSGVNLRTIQRIENNQSQPRGKTLILICDALDLDIENLLLEVRNLQNNKVVVKDQDALKMNFNYEIASKTDRLLASLVEWFLLTFLLFMPFAIFTNASLLKFIKLQSHPLGMIFGLFFTIIFGAIVYPIFKGNLGHRIFNLKVISVETGKNYDSSANGALREFLKYILSFLVIPIIWILWDENNQNLYDKITNTYVVKKNS